MSKRALRFATDQAPANNSPNTPRTRTIHTPSSPRGLGFRKTRTVKRATTTAATTTTTHYVQQRSKTAPVYHHGDETIGDILMHPIANMQEHKKRVKTFREATLKYQNTEDMEAGPDEKEEKKEKLVLIVHIKHLAGDLTFTLTPEQQENIANVLKFSEEEKVDFQSVNNSIGLMAFFDRHGREASMKFHKNEENEKEEKEEEKKAEKEEEEAKENAELGSSAATTPEVELDLANHQIPYLATDKPKTDSTSLVFVEKEHLELVLSDNMHIELKREKVMTEEEEEEEEPEKSRRSFFAPPDIDLSDELDEEKEVTWLELFYDLFYIASLSQFTHEHHIVDLSSLGVYTGWFSIIWWSWTASSLYTSRYDTDDVVHHIYKLIELCAVVCMAGASTLYIDAPTAFIIGYMVLKVVLIVEYAIVLVIALRAGSTSRIPLSAYVLVNVTSLVLWGVSLVYVTEDYMSRRLVLWYLSIVLEVAVNVALKDSKKVSLGASHIAERFGLLTLIVLGENLMGFVKMVADSQLESHIIIASMLAVIIIFAFFFMYFDDFSKKLPNKSDLNQIWLYLHFPLHLCQVAFGISLTDMVGLYQLEVSPSTASNTTAVNATDSSTAPLLTDGENTDLNRIFVYRSFLVAGGLIMAINAFIKLIHIRVGERVSIFICTARIVNAIVFWALVALNYIDISSLTMIGVMAGSLILQGMFDLLD